jgi:hypothetical protein
MKLFEQRPDPGSPGEIRVRDLQAPLLALVPRLDDARVGDRADHQLGDAPTEDRLSS